MYKRLGSSLLAFAMIFLLFLVAACGVWLELAPLSSLARGRHTREGPGGDLCGLAFPLSASIS